MTIPDGFHVREDSLYSPGDARLEACLCGPSQSPGSQRDTVKPTHSRTDAQLASPLPWPGEEKRRDHGVPGVISRKFSVREIATKSLLVARNDYICKNNTFCYTLLHTPREMQPYWAAKPGVSRQIRGHRNHLINGQL
jgi:hypothetical protein